MSHPPETSLELAAEIRKVLNIVIYDSESEEEWRRITALIDAWVRVREQETFHFIANHCDEEGFIHRVEILELATARKQQEGARHDQDEAPSAAASANSEPGGA